MPNRLQMRRTKGWRKPEGAVYVGRPSKWGNPFRVGAPHPKHGWPMSAQEAVGAFRNLFLGSADLTECLEELRGRDLACWCPVGRPCHADVLLELANGGEGGHDDGDN